MYYFLKKIKITISQLLSTLSLSFFNSQALVNMLMSLDIRTTGISEGPASFQDRYVVFLFAMLSFGYMVPWVAIGSLVNYFTVTYGGSYFVILNVAFYAVGYPVSYCQRKLDIYYDTIYGSRNTFRRRIEFCMLFQIGLVLSLLGPMNKFGYVAIVTMIGTHVI